MISSIKLLNKISFGYTENDLKSLERLGAKAYIEEQLAPNDALENPVLQTQLANLKLPTTDDSNNPRMQPLTTLSLSATELWAQRYRPASSSYREKVHPALEVAAATWLRAVHSRYQVRERMAAFWHNHFSVAASKDERIALLLPVYDRTIRAHVFGNFRNLLEAVAQSGAMQYYLNNATSRASPANENYARELFELHTLGAEAYLNHLYNRWREVPGATDGKPIGYIDEDVYEAARAFTGWTIADGADDQKGGNVPNTGDFYYSETWHDNYQKRILGTELSPNQAPLADGKKVLDLLAAHPATAQHIAKKLCIQFLSDTPSAEIVARAAEIFLKSKDAPDQIRQVLRFILNSDVCLKTEKLKNPFELVVSFVRATDIALTPSPDFIWLVRQTGHNLFDWQTPTGHPDFADFWLNPQAMLARWNCLSVLTADWQKFAKLDFTPQRIAEIRTKTAQQIADYWLEKMLGFTPNQKSENKPEAAALEKLRTTLAHYLAEGGSPDEPLILGSETETEAVRDKNLVKKCVEALNLIGMSPMFQVR
jgi:uncharacterized protein (DUF1800 family)